MHEHFITNMQFLTLIGEEESVTVACTTEYVIYLLRPLSASLAATVTMELPGVIFSATDSMYDTVEA